MQYISVHVKERQMIKISGAFQYDVSHNDFLVLGRKGPDIIIIKNAWCWFLSEDTAVLKSFKIGTLRVPHATFTASQIMVCEMCKNVNEK